MVIYKPARYSAQFANVRGLAVLMSASRAKQASASEKRTSEDAAAMASEVARNPAAAAFIAHAA